MIRLAFAFLLSLCVSAQAQLSGGVGGFPGPGTAHSSGFTPSCTESSNWLARATGVTLTVDKTRYDTMICGLVTDGVFAKLDALYIFAAPDSTTAKLSLVSATYNGATTLTHTAYQGFTGDGTNIFTTGFIPSTAGGQFSLNAASIGVYNLTSNTTENKPAMSATHGNATTLNFQPTFTTVSAFINQGTIVSVSAGNSQGFWQASRTSGSSVGLSKNGVAPTTAASTPSGLVDVQIYIWGQNNNGSIANPTIDQFSAAFIGGALSNTDIANMSSRVNTFMTAYGINVY